MQNKEMTSYPSIDKPWLKYYPKSAFDLKPQECTVYRGIYDNNKDYPNDIALLFFGKKITYLAARLLQSKIITKLFLLLI